MSNPSFPQISARSPYTPIAGVPLLTTAAPPPVAGLPEAVARLMVPQSIVVAGRTWKFLGVPDWDALLLELLMREMDEIPFWSGLWESSVGLAEWLTRHRERIRGRSMLELGCGLGLPGMIASELGAHVTQTDLYPEACAVAAENARLNNITPPESFPGDWRAWNHDRRYDFVFGSDIMYERVVFEPLLQVIRASLVPGGTLLIGDPVRPGTAEFVDERQREGWKVEFHIMEFDWRGDQHTAAVFELTSPLA